MKVYIVQNWDDVESVWFDKKRAEDEARGYGICIECEIEDADDYITRIEAENATLKDLLREVAPRCQVCDGLATHCGFTKEKVVYACDQHTADVTEVRMMVPDDDLRRIRDILEGER